MEMKRKNESRNTNHESRIRVGSALILAVVLTSLLAIIGMLFLMASRVERMATSAISENKTLDSAVEAVIARISQVLVSDVPGVGGQPDYYDYPDGENAWLASLEPYEYSLNNYRWRQISDVTGFLEEENWDAQDIEIDSDAIIEDHEEIVLDSDGDLVEQLADADGDGVADSRWIELDDITSGRGRPIYAAIRIIDNGGMLNVNTAYRFNPASPGTDGEYIDGSEQTQINLFALAQRSASNTIEQLDEERFGSESENMDNYIRDVVWRYNEPNGAYTPFDISDELELRNRYTLNRSDIDSRIEEVWDSAFQALNYLRVPVGSSSSSTIDVWGDEVYYEASDVNDVNTYSYRHIGTTYNMDRIINPVGVVLNNGKMVNVNRDGAGLIYSAIRQGIDVDPTFYDVNEIAAQTAVNLKDFRDENSDVETFRPDVNSPMYYGFERPCVYISELAHRFVKLTGLPTAPISFTIRKSYAVELYKPYTEDKYPDANQWRLSIEDYSGSPIEIDWSGTKHFHVVLFEDPNAPLEDDVDFESGDEDPCFAPSPQKLTLSHNTVVFDVGKTVRLERRVDDVNDVWIPVDSQTVPVPDGKWWAIDDEVYSYQRDITLHKCIRRLWDDPLDYEDLERLGERNLYTNPSMEMIQAHPENSPFTNVGEIGMVFREDVYRRNWDSTNTEADVRLDLADPNYHGIFKYLTVWPPSGYALDPNEVRIKGRININTAPWYVIAQLPWMSPEIARAIVAYRDKAVIPDQNDIDYGDREAATGIDGIREEAGFASIAELATVVNDSGEDEYSMRYYILGNEENDDLAGFPDLTPGGSTADGAEDDFEERDVIFSRLSNLVTVRSDVFTAYILVRIGADGPQKRVMAILDRSNVYTDDGRVQIVALHPVADPR